MTDLPPPPPPDQTTSGRSILLWRPDSDDSDVCPGVQHVAELFGVEPAAVVAAINSGDLLAGWFVDWAVVNSR